MTVRSKSLNGLRVLITRPDPLGDDIARVIEEHGGIAVQFPVIEISAPERFVALDTLLCDITDFDLLVFVSAAAIEGFTARLEQQDIRLPESLKIAVMGAKTARLGRDKGLNIDFVPESGAGAGSEGLLASLLDRERGMELENTRIAILRGQSGRDLLKAELEKRGAGVTFVPCYTRRVTTRPIQPIVDIWSVGEIDAVLITSGSILDGLIELLGPHNMALLRESSVVTISERIREQCIRQGISRVRVAGGVSSDCLLDTLSEVARDVADTNVADTK